MITNFDCKICGRECKTLRALMSHIRSHDISRKEYVDKFGDFPEGSYIKEKANPKNLKIYEIECKICGRIFNCTKLSFNMHLRNIHNILPRQYKIDYEISEDRISGIEGEDYITCPLCNERVVFLKQHLHKHFKKKEDVKSFMLRNPNLQYTAKNGSNLHKNASEVGWKDKNSLANLERVSAISKKRAEYIVNHPENSNQLNRIIKFYSNINDKTYWLASEIELFLITLLEELKINYQYESLIVYYEWQGKILAHIPDFYLPDYNLIIETKDDTYLKKTNATFPKRDACLKAGYKYRFILQSEFDNHKSTFKEYLLEILNMI